MATKRKLSTLDNLQRRVRPRREDDDSDLPSEPEVGQSTDEGDEKSDSTENSSEDEDNSNSSESDQESITQDLGTIPFGVLAKAQDALLHGDESTQTSISPLSRKRNHSALKEALQKIRASKTNDIPSQPSKNGKTAPREDKQAPPELSSKKAVSSKRTVVDVQRRTARDPRFDHTRSGDQNGPTLNEEKIKKNYAFLEEYRQMEMKTLKESIRKAKDEEMRGVLKRELLAMESRKKSQDQKDQQQQILREHRAKEKELGKMGKKPYYLKKGEQKKRVLIQRYNDLTQPHQSQNQNQNQNRSKDQGQGLGEHGRTSQTQTNNGGGNEGEGKTKINNYNNKIDQKLEKIMERKRRKNAARERKMMPFSRRNLV
ncbi:MAG: hypothetical protein M1823_004142 [Watsoniomyces obsoletus]|nr:MAG: hypothetical protein M1823_004142 [Watsoniomyces obsoletus]